MVFRKNPMLPPNQVQAVNLLRRYRAQPIKPEIQKSTQALIQLLQDSASKLNVENVLHSAMAGNPDLTAFDAILKITDDVRKAQVQETQLQAIFKAAHESEEARFKPLDEACKVRLGKIQETLDQACRDHRSLVMNQDLPERRYRQYVDRGLTAQEIEKLSIPLPIPGRDFAAERNAWGSELEAVKQPLIEERDAIIEFQRTRNELVLPASVHSLVSAKEKL